jgi:hypothetical protein
VSGEDVGHVIGDSVIVITRIGGRDHPPETC